MEVRPFDASVVWSGAKPAQVQTSWITCTPAVDDAVKSAIAAKLTIQDLDNYNVGNHTYKLQKIANSVEVNQTTYNLMVSGSYSAELTITKFTGNPVFNTNALAFVNDDLFYTSEAQALLSGGATATANGTEVPVVYATSATAENWVSWENLKETNANTTGYTVYYKVEDTNNYAGSAVQTMDGTKAIAKATITFNLSAAAGLTYNGTAQALLALTDNTKPATNFGANTLQYKIDAAEEWQNLPEAGIAGITGTSAKNEVPYSINLKVPADENGNWDETTIAAPIATTIAKATPIFTYIPTHENEGLPSGLVYSPQSQSQKLVLQQATAIVENTEISVSVKYAMRRYKNVSKGYTTWADKTYDQLVGNYASTQYQIRVKTDATDDLNQAIQQLENVVIAKATIPADAYTEPVAKNVRTTDALQPLVDAATWTGETTYGTFQYSLTNNGTDWSTDIPQGTGVAEYTVYWRIYPTVTSDTQNYDIVSGNYTSNITDKSKVTVTTVANQSFGYGTTPTIQKTVAWEEQGTDALNEAGLTWKFYAANDEECTGAEVEKVNGYYPVGTYNVIASGLNVTGTTSASQEIVYVPALVKITASQVVAEINGTATYGSQPVFTLTHTSGLSPEEAANINDATQLTKVTVKKDGEVVLNGVAPDDDGLKALAFGEYDLEAIGEYTSSANYALFVTAGKLNVVAKDIAVAIGETPIILNGGETMTYKAAKWEPAVAIDGFTADDFDLEYGKTIVGEEVTTVIDNVKAGVAYVTIKGKGNYTGTKEVEFSIGKATLKITANSFIGENAWQYGTTELTYAVTVDGQAEGETALEVGGTLAGIDGALTVVRTSNETVGMHAGALVAKFGSAQPAESDNYTITYFAGDLQVAAGTLAIKLKEEVVGNYGDDPAANITADVINDIDNYELDNCELPDANLADVVNVAAVTYNLAAIDNNKYEVNDAGYEFTLTGATSTNYAVTISNGIYKVSPVAITLYAKNQAIDWNEDDTATPNTTVDEETVAIAAGELKCGDDLADVVSTINIASTNVGTNNISLTAATNANYTITVNENGAGEAKFGVLNITAAAGLDLVDNDPDLATKISEYATGAARPVRIKFASRNEQSFFGYGKWKAGIWNTMVLPFDISVADLSKALGYAIVNVIDPSKTKVDGNNSEFYGKLTMKGGNGKDDVLAANKPFMLKLADDLDVDKFYDFGIQKVVAPTDLTVDADDKGYRTKFVGTYSPMTVGAGTELNDGKYWFMLGDYAKWAFINANSTTAAWTIVPFASYIDMSGIASAPSNMTFYFEEIDGTATAIKSVNAENLNGKSAEGMYNLNGMKLNSVPTQKGVYIQNGKKVIIK